LWKAILDSWTLGADALYRRPGVVCPCCRFLLVMLLFRDPLRAAFRPENGIFILMH
jgi:hypothetical protein